jgi:peptidoglycan-associated lipoprotein
LRRKDGYLTGEAFFSTKGIGKDPNNPVQTFEVEVVLEKIFLNKEIVLEDIYYDYDKWDIRPDAMPTLNALGPQPRTEPEHPHPTQLAHRLPGQRRLQRRTQPTPGTERCGLPRVEGHQRGAPIGEVVSGNRCQRLTCACARCTEEEHQLNRRTAFAVVEGL